MRAGHFALAQRQRGAVQPPGAEHSQPGDRAHHVHDGVNRADVVQVHGLDGFAVDGGFGLRQALEDGSALLTVTGGQRRSFDDLDHVRERARCRIAVDGDCGVRGGDSRALHTLSRQFVAVERQALELGRQVFDRDAGVDDGAEEHVAADA